MPDPLCALDAFMQEHRRRGELEADDTRRGWMACNGGASITGAMAPAG